MSGSSNAALQQTPRVLGLYRTLLKIGKAMPTENRQALVLARVKSDFRANAAEKDPAEIEAMIQLAELQVDNLEVSTHTHTIYPLPPPITRGFLPTNTMYAFTLIN